MCEGCDLLSFELKLTAAVKSFHTSLSASANREKEKTALPRFLSPLSGEIEVQGVCANRRRHPFQLPERVLF